MPASGVIALEKVDDAAVLVDVELAGGGPTRASAAARDSFRGTGRLNYG